MRALFVSDIHISSPEDPKLLLLLRLLDSCLTRGVNHVFLVGDIFDFWIADRKFLVESYKPLVEQIQSLVEAGVRVHYFEGNHDLDLRTFWQHKVGVSVHSEAAFFHIGKTAIRVEHGDQMDPKDKGYRFLRWFLRTPVMVTLGRYLPEVLIRAIGTRASARSRDYTSNVKVKTEDEVRETIRKHARWAYTKKPFEVFISGHVHIVEDSIQSVAGGTFRCINLGTWLKAPMVLDLQGSNAALREVEEYLKKPAKVNS